MTGLLSDPRYQRPRRGMLADPMAEYRGLLGASRSAVDRAGPGAGFLPQAAGAYQRSLQRPMLQRAAEATMFTPIVGDVLGLANDVATYATDAESRHPINYGLSALGLLPFIPGMTAFHGSPHKFDKFDISKIGTGEGAQAYGHGLYLAENPDIAKSYQTKLTGRGAYSIDGEQIPEYTVAHWQEPLEIAAKEGDEGLRRYIEKIDKRIAELGDDAPLEMLDVADAAQDMLGKKVERATGAFYEVDLPDEAIDAMLDWDAPLSEQPKAIRDLMRSEYPALFERGEYSTRLTHPNAPDARTVGIPADDMDGRLVYALWSRTHGGEEGASQALREMGIPGIKYFDAGSRTAGEGTRNFVVFDDSLLEIVDRK